MSEDKNDGHKLTEEQKKRRAQRNLALAAALGVIILIFYLLTVFKFGPAILHRPL